MALISGIYGSIVRRREMHHADRGPRGTGPDSFLSKRQRRRRRRKQAQQQAQQSHEACEMTVRPCGPHWGLYCVEHGRWIRWISRKDLAKIQDLITTGK
jgi:hypothetical protein